MDTRETSLKHISLELHEMTADGPAFQSIRRIQHLVYGIAKANGWHGKLRPPAEALLLIVTEIAEVYEEIRDGREQGIQYEEAAWHNGKQDLSDKPIGIDIELADIFIRLLDMAEEWHVDLAFAIHIKMQYNTTRPYRHGGKTA